MSMRRASPSAALTTDTHWPANADEFLQSLRPAQRAWFLQRDAAHEQLLQDAFATLSRGLAPVTTVHGELLAQRLQSPTAPDPDAAVPRISLATLQAYLGTRYVVDLPHATIGSPHARRRHNALTLRIGQPMHGLDGLHKARGVTESVFLTAWNPLGELQDEVQNLESNRLLQAWLDEHGFDYLPGRGIGEDPGWAPEESVLILGASVELARALCVRFRQNAAVHVGSDSIPVLVLHPDAVLV